MSLYCLSRLLRCCLEVEYCLDVIYCIVCLGSYDWNQYGAFVDGYSDELSPEGLDYKSANSKSLFANQIMTMSVRTTKVSGRMVVSMTVKA